MRFRTAALLTLLGAAGAGAAAYLLRGRPETVRLLAAGAAFGTPWIAHAALRKPTCSFLFITDTHGPAVDNAPLVRALLGESGISFVAHGGDVADSADLFQSWWDLPFRDVIARWRVLAAAGNHDYDTGLSSGAFAERFGILPRSVSCGSVDVYFLPWEANRFDAEWLLAAVKASTAQWKVLVTHRPVWPVASGGGAALRGLLLPALPYIDLVLAGHEHVYQETSHEVGGRVVRQIIDVSGPKKYACPATADGCTSGQTAYLRIDAYDDELRVVRKVVRP